MSTVIVTGGQQGIGRAIAQRFHDSGLWHIAVIDRVPFTDKKSDWSYFQADVSDPSAVHDAFHRLAEEHSDIAVLVNNAGIQRVGPTHAMPVATWKEVIDTNLTGAFLCSREIVPLFRQRGHGGAIVNMSSVAALLGLPGRGPYCAAKAGLLGLTRVMAVELAQEGIRVNAVAPGFTRTPLIQQGLVDGSLQEDWMLRRVPMARLADASDVASAVFFLASADAGFITGHCLTVDGGWSVQGISDTPDWLAGDDYAFHPMRRED